jgi:hypothetical protein
MDGRTDRQTDMTELMVTSCNFACMPNTSYERTTLAESLQLLPTKSMYSYFNISLFVYALFVSHWGCIQTNSNVE